MPGASSSLQDIDPVYAELIALASSGDITALTTAPERALARVWIGGAGAQRLRRLPPSVTKMSVTALCS
jgi:hypothetical protein